MVGSEAARAAEAMVEVKVAVGRAEVETAVAARVEAGAGEETEVG